MIASGKLSADGRTDFARAGVGVALRAGATRPSIATEDGVKAAVTAATSVAILHIGGMDDGSHHEALCVGDDVPLAADKLLSRVKTPGSTTFRRLHALALSITPAVGDASRSACSGAAITSAWLIDGQTPA